MPKRKRDALESTQKPLPSVRQLRAAEKVHRGQTVLSRAFKTAKGFERQKLTRRQKTARTSNNEKDIQRIDAEIEAIKTLDLTLVAANYLRKSLLKIKGVATSADIPENLTQPQRSITDPASLNVVARLCKSNPVRDALPQILKDVQSELGVESAPSKDRVAKSSAKDSTGTRGRANGLASNVVTGPRTSEELTDDEDVANGPWNTASDVSSAFSEASDDDRAADSAEDDDDNIKAKESSRTGDEDMDEDEDEMDYSAFDARLASDSESDSDTQTRPKRPNAQDLKALLQTTSELHSAPSDSESEPESENPSPSPSPPPPTKTKTLTTSAFLPSLTMGGYIPASDSGSEPDEELDEETGFPAQKKNRRGQRARQKIWEKKFGKEAKHVLNSKDSEGRDQGWDAKRGATDSRGRGFRGGRGGRGGGASRGMVRTGANEAALGQRVKKRDDEGKLHPSWEAAKKRKEAGVQPAAKFEGKKIRFD